MENIKEIILDGRWKYKSYNAKTTFYTFKNIYNKDTVKLTLRQIKRVLNGEDTVSHIISRRMGRDDRPNTPFWWHNSVERCRAKAIQKAVNGKK